MSQWNKLFDTPIPPILATRYDTDQNSPAIPAANILNVFGGQETFNNANGVVTDGSSGGNTLKVLLTNRIVGSGITIGAVTSDIATLALTAPIIGSIPGAIVIDAQVVAFEPTTPAAAGYAIFGTVRGTGAATVLVGTPDKIVNEEAALATADANIVVSGNDVVIRVLGVAGLTLHWNVIATYVPTV